MKTKITLLCLLAFLSFIPKVAAQCTTGTKNPIDTYQATTNAAGTSVINTDAKLGEYASVHVIPGKRYHFYTSVDTDYITITNNNGMVLASGVAPVYFFSVYNESVRYYIHQNAQCQTANLFSRTRYISWEVAPPCNDATIVGVSNISPNSCTVNLIEANPVPYFGYEVHVSTSSAEPGTSVQTYDSTTNKVFITSLNPDTTYHYWLRSDCMFRKSDWIYGGTFNTISAMLCNSAYYGLYPEATFTPTCTGNDEIFSAASKNSSYSNIAVVPNTQYTFRTDWELDFITITNAAGTSILASGQGPRTWSSGSTSGVVRFYSHTNAQCETGGVSLGIRSKYVKCTTTSVTCLPPSNLAVSNITSNSIRLTWTAPTATPAGYDIYMSTSTTAPGVTTQATSTSTTAGVNVITGLTAGLTYNYWIRSNCGSEKSSWASGGNFTISAPLVCNGAIYGLYPNATFTPACTGSAEIIAADSWAGHYSNVNVTANQQYTFSSSVATDFITITNTAGTNVLASGTSPLNWTSNTTSVIRYHLNSNANCFSQNTNRTRYIQCNAPAGACGAPTALSVSNITSNSSRLNWTAPASAPTSYDLYIITTNTAPIANTTATATSATAGIGVLQGLTAGTTYYYWIRSNCGTTKSAWVSGGSFTTIATLTCNGAINGLYPNATFTPSCTGNNEEIAPNAWAGEYSNVNVVANKQYTFTSSVAADYITITNAAGTTVLASGTSPLNWVSGTTSGVVRYHLNTNANCGTQNASRIKSIKCVGVPAGSCGVPTALSVLNITSNSVGFSWTGPATAPDNYDVHINTSNTPPTANTTAFTTSSFAGMRYYAPLLPSTTYYYWVRSSCSTTKSAWISGGSFATIAALNCNGAIYGIYPETTFTPSCTGTTEQIVGNAWAGEFSKVNVLAGKQYTFSSSVVTDRITITNATGTLVLASGPTPLNWPSGNTTGIVRYHINTDMNCGTQGTARIRSVKCGTATTPACGEPFEMYVSNITSNSAQLNWVDPSPAPTYYEIYVATNSTAPVVGTNPTTTSSFAGVYPLSGLNPNTTYYYWVRSNCSSTKSDWASGGSFTTIQALTCNGATHGLWPMDTFSPSCDGTNELVTDYGRPGSYSNVVVWENHQYTFTSSVATDFITITNEAGTVVLASGTSPLVWTTGNMNQMIVRYHINTNANCGIEMQIGRMKYMKCALALGVDDQFAENKMKIHPNPTSGQFTVETGNVIADQIAVYDSLGRVIKTSKPSSVTTNLSVSGLADGIYYVKIRYQDKDITKKLILKKN